MTNLSPGSEMWMQRMRGFGDANRVLLDRMSVINDKLSGSLSRKDRKSLQAQFDALNYALDLLRFHYDLTYSPEAKKSDDAPEKVVNPNSNQIIIEVEYGGKVFQVRDQVDKFYPLDGHLSALSIMVYTLKRRIREEFGDADTEHLPRDPGVRQDDPGV